MGLLRHFRSKSKLKSKGPEPTYFYPTGPNYSSRLPPALLEIVFRFVCPNAEDESYAPSELSVATDRCVLCDYRDLAQCASVCRSWRAVAEKYLYGSVRIDAVHFCELEDVLSEKRRRRSFLHKNALEPDVPTKRLQLFERTIRSNPSLAVKVRFLKLAYMTRETCKTELARTVSVLPNLQYVDLPEGFYGCDDSCAALRHELQARCPEIRRMRYTAGSEMSFELLAQRRHWQNLEVLDLSQLSMELNTLRLVLGSLPVLHELKLSDMPNLTDSLFDSTRSLPHFPPLQKLELENLPQLTAQGLSDYLSRPESREILSSLTLAHTGITMPTLHHILWSATNLTYLSIRENVAHPLPLDPIPPLTSITLRVLNYEITSSPTAPHALQKPSDSYYAYLSASLHSASLPALRSVYVRDPDFPESLLLVPPSAPFASEGRAKSRPGFNQSLDVYTKGTDTLDWVYTSLRPPSPTSSLYHPTHRNRRMSISQSISRPVSAYEASRGPAGPNWGGEARKSSLVGNGFGGFLAIPVADVARPGSAGRDRDRWGSVATQGTVGSMGSFLAPSEPRQERRGSRHDLWR